ncbi:hypothetical protein A7981_00630 [Methylovorus sp. MM2]|uniref:O-linked N-acetylglucosamine transferase, SPINDLY family protein n=1 Tax=Methylovorus sp. MM2 TaxID=1848038 RepID=UPI0007E23E71|nr:hypothetical protein [Methylovorus sp. MM2]OAM52032.1 hypothetical protein A7981_00630 [Methylovorus sp. MM2]
MSTSVSNQSKKLFQQGLEAETTGDYWSALTKFTAALSALGTDATPAEQVTVWTRIGYVLMRARQYRQSAEAFEFVRTLAPNETDTLYGMAVCYFYLGRQAEACDLIDRAALIRPDDYVIALERAHIRSIANSDPTEKLALYQNWGKRFADPLISKSKPFSIDLSPMRKLRVGYVSGDMREHSIAFFLEPVFANHDPENVDVFVFSTSKAKDKVTDRLKKLVPNWFDVSGMNDDALFTLIRKHKIDILIDLSGHTQGHKLFVFARRAAPVQVTWLGYIGGTLGMQAMDYRITDYGMDPVGNDQYYVEKLFRVACMASYTPPPESPLALEPPMLANGAPTLVSLNSSKKITDEMLQLWGRILEQQEDARLLIHVQEINQEDALSTLQPKLEQFGLPMDRVFISPTVPLSEFMERGFIADVALDTFPISGGTTTLHALWMGLPVVALDSAESVSASSARTLQGLGLHLLVASNEDEYVKIALLLLNDPASLAMHRKTIRDRMRASALMGYKARCIELENAYRLMWFNFITGNPQYLHSGYDIGNEVESIKTLSPEQPSAK